MTEVPLVPRQGFFRRHRILTGVFLFLIAVGAYRFFAIYRYRPDACGVRGGTPVVLNPRANPRPIGASKREAVVVMTYNIQGHATFVRGVSHIEGIAKVINDSKADIVGLNEVHRRTWQSRFDDHLTQLANLTGMNAVYAPSFSFLGGQFGNAILTRGKVRSASVLDLPTIGEPRSLLQATIDIDGQLIDFNVTHVAAWASLNQEARADQLHCAVRALRGPRTIVVGDLNAPPESAEIHAFMTETKLTLLNSSAPTHRVMEQTIDYICAAPFWKKRSSRTLDEGPSDHRAVVAELEWPGGNTP
jgi:endonuclease/exonuclease/phosphatase family metal-dependent hydrolase